MIVRFFTLVFFLLLDCFHGLPSWDGSFALSNLLDLSPGKISGCFCEGVSTPV